MANPNENIYQHFLRQAAVTLVDGTLKCYVISECITMRGETYGVVLAVDEENALRQWMIGEGEPNAVLRQVDTAEQAIVSVTRETIVNNYTGDIRHFEPTYWDYDLDDGDSE